ncbi:MAG TPA: flavodoxin family protein [Candidatus Moranbacteria bacterium]|nr:flavodoxin family protein [Candidatus Moranbacteria bacterium]
MKTLLISGSPRKGNTEFILNKIYKSIKGEKELILLRNKNIKHCAGCLYCDEHKKCAIQDDMQGLCGKMLESDVIVIGAPNYFDNVPGLMKDFIDRTNIFYETDKLKNKKLITIVVGGGEIKNSKRVGEQALKYFSNAHKLKSIGSYYFQALHLREIENNTKANIIINKIIDKINNQNFLAKVSEN